MYFPLFLPCISSLIFIYLDIVVVLIRRIIQSSVESSPELLHAVAASVSVWGGGSLQFLELTAASPVSTCIRWPLPWHQQFCWTPGSTAQGPLQWYPQSSPKSCSSLFEWTHPHSAYGAHRTSPRVTSEPQVLEFSLPGSSLDLPLEPSRIAVNSLRT